MDGYDKYNAITVMLPLKRDRREAIQVVVLRFSRGMLCMEGCCIRMIPSIPDVSGCLREPHQLAGRTTVLMVEVHDHAPGYIRSIRDARPIRSAQGPNKRRKSHRHSRIYLLITLNKRF
jgi:hypothetical protein